MQAQKAQHAAHLLPLSQSLGRVTDKGGCSAVVLRPHLDFEVDVTEIFGGNNYFHAIRYFLTFKVRHQNKQDQVSLAHTGFNTEDGR